MAFTKTEEKALAEKSPEKGSPVSNCPFQFVEKNHHKNHSKLDFKNIYKRQ